MLTGRLVRKFRSLLNMTPSAGLIVGHMHHASFALTVRERWRPGVWGEEILFGSYVLFRQAYGQKRVDQSTLSKTTLWRRDLCLSTPPLRRNAARLPVRVEPLSNAPIATIYRGQMPVEHQRRRRRVGDSAALTSLQRSPTALTASRVKIGVGKLMPDIRRGARRSRALCNQVADG